MIDLELTQNGDLKLIQFDTANTDIAVESSPIKLLRRALQTPLGYLSKFQIKNQTIRDLDFEYGNGIYAELAERMTGQTISRIRTHILNAVVVAQLNESVTDIKVQIRDFNTINVFVAFTDNQVNVTFSI